MKKQLSQISGLKIAVAFTSLAFLLWSQTPSGAQEAPEKPKEDQKQALNVKPTVTPEEALPSHIDPNEVRRGIRMGGERGKNRTQVFYERLIGKVEPDLKGKPERISQYLDLFKSEMIVDRKLFPFDVQGEWKSKNQLLLSGLVGYEENLTSLLLFLQYLGFENVNNQVEVLPSKNLGKLKFALVKVPHAYTYAKPTEKSEPMTQGLLGDPVYLLKMMPDDFFLCQTLEGYVGYINGDQIQRVDSKKFTRYQNGPQVYVLKDQKKGEELLIPFGARLKKAGDKGSDVIVELPGGSKASIPKNQVEVRENRTHERIENAIKIAEQMMGSRYAWGGKTSEGVDCSGLIQASFRSQGINMPRDAYQQIYVGSLVATRWYMEGLRRGDTLFFLGRRGTISHVAIYLGDDQYLEASRGDVHYTSFNSEHENFNERKLNIFCFAKRVLD